MNGGKKFWVGLLLSAIFLALFFVTLDFGRLIDTLAEANYVFVVPGIGLYLVGVWFRTLRWQWLLKHKRPVKASRLFPVVVVGYMANNLLPMRLGELVRSYYVGEREGISKTAALSTIFIERLLDAITLLTFVAMLSLAVPLATVTRGFEEQSTVPWALLVTGTTVPFGAAFIGLLLIASYPNKSLGLVRAFVRPIPSGAEARILGFVELFVEGLASLKSPKMVGVLFLLSIPVWLFEAGLFVLVGYSFGFHEIYDSVPDLIIAMVLVTAIANIGASIPAAPGGIGLFELIARETLVLLPLAAIDRAVAGGYVAVVHASLLLPMIVLGQVFLWSEHVSLRSLTRRGQEDSSPAASLPHQEQTS